MSIVSPSIERQVIDQPLRVQGLKNTLESIRATDGLGSETLGRIRSIDSSRITVSGPADGVSRSAIRVGSLVKIKAEADVIGIVDSMALEDTSSSLQRVLYVDLVGEIAHAPGHDSRFRRGVSCPPGLGDPIVPVSESDIKTVYTDPSKATIRIGTLSANERQPAFVSIDDLLGKHFAVVGSTGSGKSCTVTLIISAILAEEPNAHIILIDPHDEYSAAFGDIAELINVHNEELPFWLLNREEAIRVMIRGGTDNEQQVQALLLKTAITEARRRYASESGSSSLITVDTPVPYLASDLRRLLNEGMGRVDKSADVVSPYRHLLARLESLQEDPRFGFMFGATSQGDRLAKLIGRVQRIPVAGKPLTIIDLSGVPADISDVVVSVTSRVLFDFTLHCDPERRTPVLLVCEEAHRYLPAEGNGFAACTEAISRIAREGRKYGLSLALISQRPTELSPSALTQCGTIFALRLGSERDQRFIEAVLPDANRAMLKALSSLPTQQAMVFGEGVPLPLTVRFDNLASSRVPRSHSASFSEAWKTDTTDEAYCEDAVQRWRENS
jgi:uncharacterized protein